MDIIGVGEENAALLYDAGLVKDIADFYTLKADEMEALDRVGPRTAQRILEGVEASKSVPFDRVVYALSIPYVGETVARKLARGVGDIDTLLSKSRDELTAIDDIGPRIADAIIEYFAVPGNREIVERLRAAGVQMALPEEDKSTVSDLLAGKTIVISGVFALHSREEYKEMIEKNGGKNSGFYFKKDEFRACGRQYGSCQT